jgi:predicted TIM-barrel fold metal-dependent hydrolase
MSGQQIVDSASLLAHLPCPIVFDHMGRLPPKEGPDYPAFRVIADLLDRRRAWVKLAGAYLNTEQGPPDYADAMQLAQAFVRIAPERLVWGSDWPHTLDKRAPDDALLLDLLTAWTGDIGPVNHMDSTACFSRRQPCRLSVV